MSVPNISLHCLTDYPKTDTIHFCKLWTYSIGFKDVQLTYLFDRKSKFIASFLITEVFKNISIDRSKISCFKTLMFDIHRLLNQSWCTFLGGSKNL